MRVKQIQITYWGDALVGEREDNLGYTPAGTGQGVVLVATVPGLGGGIPVQGKAVPICGIQQVRY